MKIKAAGYASKTSHAREGHQNLPVPNRMIGGAKISKPWPIALR
jgi:hypothetical protein